MEIYTLCSSWKYIFNQNPFDHEIEYGNDLKQTPKRLIVNIVPFLDLIFFKKHISFEIIQYLSF